MEQRITWKSPKKLLFLLVSLLLLAGFWPLAKLADPEVRFLDPNLEQVIREKINQPTKPIYRTHVLKITELDASGKGITRLDGIEALRRLSVLNLEDNFVEDLSPLASLGLLSELNLNNNQITNLEAVNFDRIRRLPLRSLSLRHNVDEAQNRLVDIGLLSELRQLESLDLRDNHVADISPLAGLGSLQQLNLRENHVKNIQPVQFLTGLVYLNIHSNPIESGLSALGNLHNLQTLIMRNVEIGENYEFLLSLTKLRRLNIRNSAITDVNAIAELMKSGALQDDEDREIKAYIDLLEISPNDDGTDPYLDLRRYWNNISYRHPISLPYYPSTVKPAVFSHESGFYTEGFYLTISTDEPGGEIYYTLDGSEPALTPGLEPMGSTQVYTGPILVQSRVGEPNLLSDMETSRGIAYRPAEEMFKLSIVRVVAIDKMGNRSNVLTQTYIIDKEIAVRYTFPLVSIVTNSENLFDDEIGIYVPGNINLVDSDVDMEMSWWYPANFMQRGLKWERPVSFQMFSSNGELIISQNLGMRIHGHATRYFNPKSFRLHAKTEYDEQSLMQYDFFSGVDNSFYEKTIAAHKSLIFRSGGNDEKDALFRDILAQDLLQNTKLDIQQHQPVIVFINGEYWGIHNIRTRYDEYYFQTHYGLDADELLVLRNGEIRIGDVGNIEHYTNIFKIIDENYVENNYLTRNTLAEDKAYREMAARVDIENFISYYAAQIYFNNGDWPQNNAPMWAKAAMSQSNFSYGHDGKWRWIVLDVDSSFRNPSFDNLTRLTYELNHDLSTYLFRSLLENREFRHQLINKIADYLNTIFREDIVVGKIDNFETLYYTEIEEHIQRWGTLGGSLDSWLQNVDEIRKFALLRPTYQRQQTVENFNLPGTATVKIQTNPVHGYIQINTVDIREGAVGVNDPASWAGIYFQNVPVKITAVPAAGYRFVRWKEIGSEDAELVLVLTEDITLTAEFEKED